MEFSYEVLSILFVVAIIAAAIDTIAGGGGLITLPALLWAGVPPVSALATNKLQSVFGSFTASSYFVKKKLVDLNEMKLMIFMAFFGSMFGGYILLQIDVDILRKLIPFLIMAIGLYFLFSKKISDDKRERRMSIFLFSITFSFIIGFYDGFFGPGTGSFYVLVLMLFLGQTISQGTAKAKVLNFTTNAASVIFFALFGDIYYAIGLVMGLGQIIGALIGAKLVVYNGEKLIRPLIIIVSFTMSINLLMQ